MKIYNLLLISLILLLPLSSYSVEETESIRHLDFVLLENNEIGQIDSLFYYDTESNSYKKIEYTRLLGGINVSKNVYSKIADSDSLILYLKVHDDDNLPVYSVPIKLSTYLFEDSVIRFSGHEYAISRWRKKKYCFLVEFDVYKGAYSMGQTIRVAEY